MFLGTPLYLGVLIVFARYARVARHSIALRFENVDLIHQLREQTARSGARAARRRKPTAPSPCSWPRPADLRQPLHARPVRRVAGPHPARRAPAPVDRAHPLLLGRARARCSIPCSTSQLDAGVVVARPRAFRLQPLLHKLENEFAPQANARGLVYRTRDTTAVLFGDPPGRAGAAQPDRQCDPLHAAGRCAGGVPATAAATPATAAGPAGSMGHRHRHSARAAARGVPRVPPARQSRTRPAQGWGSAAIVEGWRAPWTRASRWPRAPGAARCSACCCAVRSEPEEAPPCRRPAAWTACRCW